MTHVVLPRLTQILADELPDVLAALEADGALRTNRVRSLPEAMTGGFRPCDECFEQVSGRRPMVEATLAACADREEGMVVRRGVAVDGLLTGPARPGDVPHVAGVVLASGEQVTADLVVSTTGRRSALPAMLESDRCGARPSEEVAPHGFTYYCRTFRSADGSPPPMFGPPLQHYDSLSFVTAPADNGTWSVAIVASGNDRWMRHATDADVWSRIVRAYPRLAHWVDGEPISDVEVMSATPDRTTRLVVGGHPVATGVIAMGDALACTSPMFARGMTFAALQAVCLRDVLREVSPIDPAELAHRWTDRVGNVVMPLIDETLAIARHRLAEIDAQVAGRLYETDDPLWPFLQRLFDATPHDPELLRAVMGVAGVFVRAGDIARRRDLVARLDAVGDLPAAPGPTRRDLVELLDTAGSPESCAR